MIRVVLPYHLRVLADIQGEVPLEVAGRPTLAAVFDALEARYPSLQGTIRDPRGRRRPLLRFFACRQDISDLPLDAPLPDPVIRGEEPLLVVGAVAGG